MKFWPHIRTQIERCIAGEIDGWPLEMELNSYLGEPTIAGDANDAYERACLTVWDYNYAAGRPDNADKQEEIRQALRTALRGVLACYDHRQHVIHPWSFDKRWDHCARCNSLTWTVGERPEHDRAVY